MTKARDIAGGGGQTIDTQFFVTKDANGAIEALDGSALTNLTSGNLNGALPNIDGSSLTGIAAGGGKVLQVVTEKYTTNKEISSTSFVEVFSKSITPTSDTSQILVLISGGQWALYSSPSYEAYYQVNRGGTELMTGLQTIRQVSANIASGTISVSYLDSPASSSAVSYNIKAKTSNASKSVSVCNASNPITMTLIEIAA